LVEVVVRERGLLVEEEEVRFAVARSEIVVSSATPARGGRAIHSAPRMLGIGRERESLRWRA
jgi:hypothetical protein